MLRFRIARLTISFTDSSINNEVNIPYLDKFDVKIYRKSEGIGDCSLTNKKYNSVNIIQQRAKRKIENHKDIWSPL